MYPGTPHFMDCTYGWSPWNAYERGCTSWYSPFFISILIPDTFITKPFASDFRLFLPLSGYPGGSSGSPHSGKASFHPVQLPSWHTLPAHSGYDPDVYKRQSLMWSNPAVPVILLPAILMQARRRESLAGKQNMGLRICVQIPGDGRRTIQTVMRIN